MMKTIVITGAAGLIGSAVVSYLNQKQKFNLTLVDLLDHPDKVKNLAEKKYSCLISIQDCFSWLEGREKEIEAIIHLGACSDTMEQNGSYLQKNNTLYTIRLAEYALQHGLRFIYASSAATYGDGSQGFSDDHDGLRELKPLNLYAKSKHDFDLWASAQGVLNQIVGLKYFNVFGPNEAHKGHMSSVIFKTVPVVQKEGVLRLFKSTEPGRFKDGDQCRDFIYVKDVAEMTCQFLEDSLCGIYNIGMGVASTWNQIAKAIFSALGMKEQIEYIDMPKELAARYQNYTCARMEKYKQARGLHLGFTLESAIKDYIQHHLVTGKVW